MDQPQQHSVLQSALNSVQAMMGKTKGIPTGGGDGAAGSTMVSAASASSSGGAESMIQRTQQPEGQPPQTITQTSGSSISEGNERQQQEKTAKKTELLEGLSLQAGLASMQGRRPTMQDGAALVIGLPGCNHASFFGVFDGHGGSEAASFASKHLLAAIMEQPSFKAGTGIAGSGCASDPHALSRAIIDGYLEAEQKQQPGKGAEQMEQQRKRPYSGSTAVVALITPDHYVVGNAGDSRALLVRADGAAIPLSRDHKPYLDDEKGRIEEAGSQVTQKPRKGAVPRIDGSLAVSRGLGDFDFKTKEGKAPQEQAVSAEPEVTVVERHSNDLFLVLACDGVWDCMTNEEVGSMLSTTLLQRYAGRGADMRAFASAVIDECYGRGSNDNLSALIVALPSALEQLGPRPIHGFKP